jgi:hypothetical protein
MKGNRENPSVSARKRREGTKKWRNIKNTNKYATYVTRARARKRAMTANERFLEYAYVYRERKEQEEENNNNNNNNSSSR